MTTRTTMYRTVQLQVFCEPNSQHWFYEFPFEWTWYRSNQGYKTYSDAREAGEDHIDKVLAKEDSRICQRGPYKGLTHKEARFLDACREDGPFGPTEAFK